MKRRIIAIFLMLSACGPNYRSNQEEFKINLGLNETFDGIEVYKAFQKSDGRDDGPDQIFLLLFSDKKSMMFCKNMSNIIDVNIKRDVCYGEGRIRSSGAHVSLDVNDKFGVIKFYF